MAWLTLLFCCTSLLLRSEEDAHHPLLDRLDLLGLSSANTSLLTSQTGREISIEISVFEIELLMRGEVVTCRGIIDGVEVDWIITCSHCHQLQLSAEEIMCGKINLFDHLIELIPKEGEVIGLVTWQNGMNNTLGSFRKFSNAVIQHLPDGILGIGLYNPTGGFYADCFRIFREFAGMDTAAVARTRYMLSSLIDFLPQINPDVVWIHVCHSEGGLLASNSIAGMNDEQRKRLSKHLVCITLGSVLPISTHYVREAVNYYSEHDYLTNAWTENYLNQPNYRVQILDCLTPLEAFDSLAGDHLFLEATYQRALESVMQELLGRWSHHCSE